MKQQQNFDLKNIATQIEEFNRLRYKFDNKDKSEEMLKIKRMLTAICREMQGKSSSIDDDLSILKKTFMIQGLININSIKCSEPA